jgi:hypothetical protein
MRTIKVSVRPTQVSCESDVSAKVNETGFLNIYQAFFLRV